MNKVGILGSCVTRDVFQYLKGYEVSFYIARGSLASIYAPAWTVEASPEQLKVEGKGDFENRMLRYDLNKEAVNIIRDGVDYPLFIDFIDERFDLIIRGESIITRSNFLMLTDYGKTLNQGRLLRRDTEESKQLWKNAALQFLDDLQGRPIILHRAFWAEAYLNDDTGEVCRFRESDLNIVLQQNEVLKFYYDFIVDNYQNTEVVEPDPKLVFSNFAHRWGRDFFHFSDAYYKDIAVRVEEVMPKLRHNAAHLS